MFLKSILKFRRKNAKCLAKDSNGGRRKETDFEEE